MTETWGEREGGGSPCWGAEAEAVGKSREGGQCPVSGEEPKVKKYRTPLLRPVSQQSSLDVVQPVIGCSKPLSCKSGATVVKCLLSSMTSFLSFEAVLVEVRVSELCPCIPYQTTFSAWALAVRLQALLVLK